MKTRLSILPLFLPLLLTLAAAAGPSDPTDALAPTRSITAGELHSLLNFLASDEMQGRDTNSPANRIAARFLAEEFETLGLKPAGDEGSYFQQVVLVQSRLGEENRLTLDVGAASEGASATVQVDFVPSTASASGQVSAELVFAGYGISAPEYAYDDYAGLQMEGRIALLLAGRPGERGESSPFDAPEASEYRRELYKIRNAQEHGAAAVILFDPQREGDISRLAKRSFPEDPERARLELKFRVDTVTIPALTVSHDFLKGHLPAEVDLAALKQSIDSAIHPHSRLLEGTRATLRTDVEFPETRISNVLAMIPGSDEQLRDQVVIVGAHYDHVGTRGNEVFNGADDDGSGTVGILEIAEAFVEGGLRPRRTILFALWNAEERGLLGSRYYVQSPVIPLEKTAAMFQLDMIGRDQEVPEGNQPRFGGMDKETAERNLNSLNMIGYSYSSDLQRLVEEQNRSIGLELRLDMEHHKLNLLRRSDQWPFLEKGVPAIFFTTGLHPDYHTPADTPDKIDYSKLERVTRLAFLCVLEAANRDQAPRFQAPSKSDPVNDGEE